MDGLGWGSKRPAIRRSSFLPTIHHPPNRITQTTIACCRLNVSLSVRTINRMLAVPLDVRRQALSLSRNQVPVRVNREIVYMAASPFAPPTNPLPSDQCISSPAAPPCFWYICMPDLLLIMHIPLPTPSPTSGVRLATPVSIFFSLFV